MSEPLFKPKDYDNLIQVNLKLNTFIFSLIPIFNNSSYDNMDNNDIFFYFIKLKYKSSINNSDIISYFKDNLPCFWDDNISQVQLYTDLIQYLLNKYNFILNQSNITFQYTSSCNDCNNISNNSISNYIIIPNTYYWSASFISEITKKLLCLHCNSFNINSSIKLPEILLLCRSINNNITSKEKIEIILHIGLISYELISIIVKDTILNTYYSIIFENNNIIKYSNYTTTTIENINDKHGIISFDKTKIIIALCYKKKIFINNKYISCKELLQICHLNDFDIKQNNKVLTNIIHPKNIFPTISSCILYNNNNKKSFDVQFSRQEYLVNNQNEIKKYRILIIGLNPITCEVVKNLISMGFLDISIYFNNNSSNQYNYNYFLWRKKSSITENYIYLKKLAKQINQQAKIKQFKYNITTKTLQLLNINCILVINQYIPDLISLNKIARSLGIYMIASDCMGLFFSIFVDHCSNNEITYSTCSGNPLHDEKQIFISNIKIIDKNEENINNSKYSIIEITTIISYYNLKINSLLRVLDSIDNEYFDIKIIKIINNTQFYAKIVNNKISNILKIFESNPIDLQITKKIRNIKVLHKSLEQSLENPSFNQELVSFTKWKNYILFLLYTKYKTLYCSLDNNKIDDNIWNSIISFLKQSYPNSIIPYERYIINKILYSMRGNIPPITTILGGILAHCILVANTKRFQPINQWEFKEFSSILDDKCFENLSNKHITKDINSSIFNENILNELKNLKILQIGCGATGCETIKILSEMKVGQKGKITLVDGDLFSKSNRNRQFLCLNKGEFRPKSEVAKSTLQKRFNKSSSIINTFRENISDSNIQKFPKSFFKEYDIIIGTVDSWNTREYLCQLSHVYNKYFIECGTGSLDFSATVFKPKINNELPSKIYKGEKNKGEEHLYNCNPVTYCFLDSHAILSAGEIFNLWFNEIPSLYFSNTSYSTKNINNTGLIEFIKLFNNFNLQGIEMLFKVLFHQKFNKEINDIIQNELDKESIPKIPEPIHYNINIPSHKECFLLFKDIINEIYNNYSSIIFDKESQQHLQMIQILATIKCDCFSINNRNFNLYRIQRIVSHAVPAIISSTSIAAGLNMLNLYAIVGNKLNYTSKLSNYFGSLATYSIRNQNKLGYSNERQIFTLKNSTTLLQIKQMIKSLPFITLIDEYKCNCKLISQKLTKNINLQSNPLDNKRITSIIGGKLERITLCDIQNPQMIDIKYE